MQLLVHSKSLVLSLLTLAALLAPIAHSQKFSPSVHKPTERILNAKRLPAAAKTRIAAGYAHLPLAFEPNVGQIDKQVRFLTHAGGGTLFLTDTEAILTLPLADLKANTRQTHSRFDPKQRSGKHKPALTKFTILRMKLIGAQKPLVTVGLKKLPGIVNYFRGNNPKQWHSNIPTYQQAKFAGVYKGVDMVYYGSQNGKLEYDFVVKPGADPKAIKLAFSGVTGARVTATGELALEKATGEVRWQRPVTYQMIGGHREAVACAYELKREDGQERVGFRLARYDRSRQIVIDPTLTYSTYLGGSGDDWGTGIAVDSHGSAYVTGNTGSINFPVTSTAFQTMNKAYAGGDDNAFVTKLTADGSSLVYSTYLGGSGGSGGQGIVVDSNGNAYVTGAANSVDFPTTPGAFQTTGGGAFVTKLSADGSALVYSTCLGTSAEGLGIAVDGTGNAYVTGAASSLPVTVGAFQTTLRGSQNAFVTKLSADGSALVYSTYLGGSLGDFGTGIAVDNNGSAYVTGQGTSIDFPITPEAYQTMSHGRVSGFVTKLSAGGSSLVYSTYLGGSDDGDWGNAIAVDRSGNAYVTGEVSSSNFPITPGAFQMTYGGKGNAFVTKLNATGSSLVYSTYLGGSGTITGEYYDDEGIGIAIDSSDNVYVTGLTSSSDFPTTPGAFQVTLHGNENGFLTKLSADGSTLDYSTYLGGSVLDRGYGIVVDSNDNVYVAGLTSSSDFPTTPGAFQTTLRGSDNAFIAKFAFVPLLVSLNPSNATVGGTPFVLILTGNAFAPGANVLWNGVSRNTMYLSPTQLVVVVTAADLTKAGGATVSVRNPAPDVEQSNTLIFTIGQPQLLLDNVTSLTRNGNTLSATIQLTNVGTAIAANAQMTAATLNGVNTTTSPLPKGTITTGTTVSVTLTFPGTAGNSGQTVFLKISGTYGGGSYSGTERVTLP